jgi:hypothetical protein
MSRLSFSGEINDVTGMASAILAAEVGYPGSSIAFAQLLSGMQRSGLIERDVRGKRTYRIAAVPGAAARVAAAAQARRDRRPAEPGQGPSAVRDLTGGAVRAGAAGPAGAAGLAGSGLAGGPGPTGGPGLTSGAELAGGPGLPGGAVPGVVPGLAAGAGVAPAGAGEFDYDELARRLLVQVVRRLASAPEEAQPGPGGIDLEQTVAGLQRELATVRTMHGTLTAENARLRDQLSAARRRLALAQGAAGRSVGDQLDAAEAGLLERLLVSAGDETRPEDAEAG